MTLTSEWKNLLAGAEITEVPVRAKLEVEAPAPLVTYLAKLREPGANGGRQVASLPVGEQGARVLRATLKAATEKLDPPASVTIKSVYAAEDEVQVWTRGEGDSYEETFDEPSEGEWDARFVVRDGAEPIALKFSVGNKRGKRAVDAPAAE